MAWERELEKYLSGSGIRQIVIRNHQLLVTMVVKKAGIVLFPDCVGKRYRETGQLAVMNYELPKMKLWKQTIYHRNKWVTEAMKAWLDMQGEQTDECCESSF